jgi:hypothetical protein
LQALRAEAGSALAVLAAEVCGVCTNKFGGLGTLIPGFFHRINGLKVRIS